MLMTKIIRKKNQDCIFWSISISEKKEGKKELLRGVKCRKQVIDVVVSAKISTSTISNYIISQNKNIKKKN